MGQILAALNQHVAGIHAAFEGLKELMTRALTNMADNQSEFRAHMQHELADVRQSQDALRTRISRLEQLHKVAGAVPDG